MLSRPDRIAAVIATAVLAAVLVPSRASAATPRPVPWTGAAGVTVTTGELMAAGPGRPAVSGPDGLTGPDRSRLPGNPSSPPLPSSAPAPHTLAPRVTSAVAPGPTVATSFLAATGDPATGPFPPDSMGVPGPTQFVLATNGRVRTFTKATGQADGVLDLDPTTFFAPALRAVAAPAGTRTSDPRIRFDRLSGRWLVTIIDLPGGRHDVANHLLLAVSSEGTLTPATAWTFFSFRQDQVGPAGDTGRFADYPTLGVDAHALYVGVNIFDAAGAFTGTAAFVVRKASVLGTGPLVATAFRNLVVQSSACRSATAVCPGLFSPQGVDNDDPAATEGLFVGVDNAATGRLLVRRVTDPGGTPSISADLPLAVPATAVPLLVPHAGNTGGESGKLDGLDDRLIAAQVVAGHLWTTHSVAVDATGASQASGNDRNGVRWYEIAGLSGTPSLAQVGTLYDGAASSPASYWMGSIATTRQGYTTLGASVAGADRPVHAVVASRWSGDPPGELRTPVDLTPTASASYNPPGDPGGLGGRRWGDYSMTAVDPADGMSLWTVQEFVAGAGASGLQVARLAAPPPPAPTSASPSSLPRGTGVAVTLSAAGGAPGYLDPGSAGPGTLSVTVPGVAVTSATATATDVSLVLDTRCADSGPLPVTLTHPDGQTVTSPGLISVADRSATLASLAVAPVDSSWPKGTSRPYTATGHFSDGTDCDLSTAVSWAAGDSSVASVAPGGRLTASAVGSTTVTASLGTTTASTGVTVRVAEPQALEVAGPALRQGQQGQYAVTAVATDGTRTPVDSGLSWALTDPGTATVDGAGRVTALRRGYTGVLATAGTLTGSAALTVTELVTGLAVTPAAPTLAVGATVALSASGRYADASTVPLTGWPPGPRALRRSPGSTPPAW